MVEYSWKISDTLVLTELNWMLEYECCKALLTILEAMGNGSNSLLIHAILYLSMDGISQIEASDICRSRAMCGLIGCPGTRYVPRHGSYAEEWRGM